MQQSRSTWRLPLRLGLVAPTVAVVVLASTVGYADAGQDEPERQGTIAFVRTPPGGPSPKAGVSLFVIRADGTGLRRLTARNSYIGGYRWSPDGSLIAYLDKRALWLVRPDGTGRVRLVSRSILNILSLTWSPDGKAIAVLAQDPSRKPPWASRPRIAEIYVVPTDGGAPQSLHTGDVRDPAWWPLGDEIAYATPGGEIRTMRIDGSSSTQHPHARLELLLRAGMVGRWKAARHSMWRQSQPLCVHRRRECRRKWSPSAHKARIQRVRVRLVT